MRWRREDGESVMQHPTTLTLVAAHAARSGQKQQQVVAGGGVILQIDS